MSSRTIAELLAQHADQLNRQEKINVDDFVSAAPESRTELAVLLSVASRIKQTLRPTTPAGEFRARLRNGLLLAAHHRDAHQLLLNKPNGPTWGWLLRAAALGSAAGLIAILLRSRAGSSDAIPSHESIRSKCE